MCSFQLQNREKIAFSAVSVTAQFNFRAQILKCLFMNGDVILLVIFKMNTDGKLFLYDTCPRTLSLILRQKILKLSGEKAPG